ncbi:ABC transporter ATP-binding protein [Pleionea sp. CnH1-48]|uniref:ABC transporter ATP-binding protein n=1 Tax=Pleionea sp. CnH1-48 TaxID=2954494 RepID=UPI002096A4EF|nr:ABC transporter ATP-binding protein [Pleionea sp. CnH1-48]MCO7226420.1 ABC transporter ATP-binding protein [Pleionea sp. CnH1-48]
MNKTALKLTGLRKIYANGFEALKGIDLEVESGDFLALLGPNGAGKSTTIGIVSSLVNKSEGQVTIFGYDLDKETFNAKSSLGLVPQEFNFSQFETPWQIVINQAGYYGIPRNQAAARVEQLLKQLGLWEKRDGPSRNLSGGMKRRLMIARALVHDPKLLILDEPTAGVDIELRRSMWEFLTELNEQGTTIVLTTHYLEEAESLCRNIAIIDQGRIVENTSKKALLAKLDMETFIFDIEPYQGALPDYCGQPVRQLDEVTLEVDILRHDTLNDLFVRFKESGITVLSMRNKANRLEELFVRLVESND